jgi:hypothetical protein
LSDRKDAMTKIVAEKIIVLANSTDLKIHWVAFGRNDRQGTQAVPSWDSRMRWSNLLIGLAVR